MTQTQRPRYSLGIINYPDRPAYQIVDGHKLGNPLYGRNSAALARRFHGHDRAAAQAEVNRLNGATA